MWPAHRREAKCRRKSVRVKCKSSSVRSNSPLRGMGGSETVTDVINTLRIESSPSPLKGTIKRTRILIALIHCISTTSYGKTSKTRIMKKFKKMTKINLKFGCGLILHHLNRVFFHKIINKSIKINSSLALTLGRMCRNSLPNETLQDSQ